MFEDLAENGNFFVLDAKVIKTRIYPQKAPASYAFFVTCIKKGIFRVFEKNMPSSSLFPIIVKITRLAIRD